MVSGGPQTEEAPGQTDDKNRHNGNSLSPRSGLECLLP